MTGRGAGRRPAAAPGTVWVLADRPDTLARLLLAVDQAGMVPTVRSSTAIVQPGVGEPTPAIVLVDACALVAATPPGLDRIRRELPDAALVVIADERPVHWLANGATAVLPPPASTTAIALQLRRLLELHPEQPWAREQRHGPLVFDPGRACVLAGGIEVRCSPTLTVLLLRLLQGSGEVVTLGELDRALRRSNAGDATDVRSQVRRLRACLDRAVPGLGDSIRTLRGIGYRLDADRASAACLRGATARPGDRVAGPPEGEAGNTA